MMLNEDQIEEFSRQLILPGWGAGPQQRLSDARILLTSDYPVLRRYLQAAGAERVFRVGETDSASFLVADLEDYEQIAARLAPEIGSVLISPDKVRFTGHNHKFSAVLPCFSSDPLVREALAAALLLRALISDREHEI